jgi:hypothetical protein
MPFLEQEKFTFVSRGLDESTFGVIHFQGSEGLSRCYRFEVSLVSERDDLDLTRVLKNPARSPSSARTATFPFTAFWPSLSSSTPSSITSFTGPYWCPGCGGCN